MICQRAYIQRYYYELNQSRRRQWRLRRVICGACPPRSRLGGSRGASSVVRSSDGYGTQSQQETHFGKFKTHF
jgi:MoaA/NifB/PqqE/SkfB family radical SAM enzyme